MTYSLSEFLAAVSPFFGLVCLIGGGLLYAASLAPPMAYPAPWARAPDVPIKDTLFRRLWGRVHGIDTRARYRALTGADGARYGEGPALPVGS